MAGQIEKRTGFETRRVVLNHLQRGGRPSAVGRLMGRKFGIAAVDLILEEEYGRMTALRGGEITSAPLQEAVEELKTVDAAALYGAERCNGRRSSLL